MIRVLKWERKFKGDTMFKHREQHLIFFPTGEYVFINPNHIANIEPMKIYENWEDEIYECEALNYYRSGPIRKPIGDMITLYKHSMSNGDVFYFDENLGEESG